MLSRIPDNFRFTGCPLAEKKEEEIEESDPHFKLSTFSETSYCAVLHICFCGVEVDVRFHQQFEVRSLDHGISIWHN